MKRHLYGILVFATIVICFFAIQTSNQRTEKKPTVVGFIAESPKNMKKIIIPEDNDKLCERRIYTDSWAYCEIPMRDVLQPETEDFSRCFGLQEKLYNAIKKGDLANVEQTLQDGANIEATFQDSFPMLQTAVLTDNSEIIAFLIDNGADVNREFGSFDMTALLQAAVNKRENAVRLLIDKGADVCGESADLALKNAEETNSRRIIQLIENARAKSCL